MPWNAKELEARAPVLAAALVAVLEKERLVARFIDAYVDEAKRPALKAHAERYRELLATIGRESLLAMAAETDRVLERSLARPRARQGGQGRRGGQAGRRAAEALAGLFRGALVAALGEKLGWDPEEREAFGRDLELYVRLDEGGAGQPATAGKRSRAEPPRGPFVDRSALLLDPPLLPQARRAAAAYQAELERQGERAFRRAFRAPPEKRTRRRG